MTSVVQRPATVLPDVFGWLESGWPFGTNAVRVEQYVDDDHYVVRAELPGFDPDEDIKVAVDNGRLILTAHRSQPERRHGHSEFHYGTFTRTVPVPAGVTAKDVSAAYLDGILEITMPATALETAQPVEVKIGKGQ